MPATKSISPSSPSSVDNLKKISFSNPAAHPDQVIKRTKIRSSKPWPKLILAILFLIIFLLGVSIYPTVKLFKHLDSALTSARAAYDAAKNQNLPVTDQQLKITHDQLLAARTSYNYLIWLKATPLYWHYTDGQHALEAGLAGVEAGQILVAALEPYADVLGFEGQGSFLGGTAEDRITKAVETLDKVTPALDEVAKKLALVNDNVARINPKRYPITIKNINLQSKLTEAQTLSTTALSAVKDAQPIIKVLPQIAGVESEKTYLVIFQNDGELRSTGGFITAYSVLKVTKGKVTPVKSDDIYSLDAKFRSRLEPPEPIKKYLKNVFYWHLRDMNLSPDFKSSMNTFHRYYQTLSGEPKIDGIIAVDTKILKDLVEVLGPIDVPGYGTFSVDLDPRCDCPQIIYQLELIADRPTYKLVEGRKAVLGPMMQTILFKAYGSPKQLWPKLFETGINNIIEKHVLFYFFDDTAQSAAETVNIAGRIKDFDADYLHINDSNFGGAKSNMFITQEVDQIIELESDKVKKTVTITYKNPAPASNCNLEAGQLCLNGIMPDYFRLYTPAGSQLVEALGFEENTVQTKEELGKTVFEGFFKLQPQSQAKVKLTYTIPYVPKDSYRLLIQKQPGTLSSHYTLTINNNEQQEFDLTTDKILDVFLR